MNHTLEEMLRAYIRYEQNNWEDKLAATKFAHNNTKNTSTNISPFKATYRRKPPYPYDKFRTKQIPVSMANKIKEQITYQHGKAQDSLALAKVHQENNTVRDDVEYIDLLLLTTFGQQ